MTWKMCPWLQLTMVHIYGILTEYTTERKCLFQNLFLRKHRRNKMLLLNFYEAGVWILIFQKALYDY